MKIHVQSLKSKTKLVFDNKLQNLEYSVGHIFSCQKKNRFELMIIRYILTGNKTRPQIDYY